MVEWGYTKQEVRVDTNVLKVAGKEILKAEVKDFALQLLWSDGEWEKWEELQGAREFADLKKTTREKLDRAKAASAGENGKGKGKNKSSS